MVTHHGRALLVFAITWAATSAALWLLAVALANALSTVVGFAAMRRWIFRRDAK